jgi:hypothetical protein
VDELENGRECMRRMEVRGDWMVEVVFLRRREGAGDLAGGYSMVSCMGFLRC